MGTDFQKVVVPPFLLEIHFANGSQFFFHSLAFYEEEDDLVIAKVWDMRLIQGAEMTKLMNTMNETWGRDAYKDHEKIHPQLDWGLLSFKKSDLTALVEWADRYWPVELKERRERLGFRLQAEG